jgi:hypothetical protein
VLPAELRARSSLGNVTCGLCRAVRVQEGEPSINLVYSCTRNAIDAMTAVASTSASGFAELVQAFNNWEEHHKVQSVILPGRVDGRVFALPVHNLEAALSFIDFLTISSNRTLSLGSYLRMMGAYIGILKISPNVTIEPEFKKLKERRLHESGIKSEPRTSATRAICVGVFEEEITKITGECIRARAALEVTLEMNGLKVGEVTNHGQGHGASANDSCIMTKIAPTL